MKNEPMPMVDPETSYGVLLEQIRAGIAERDVRLVGIHSGGAWIAERLHRDLGLEAPLGTLSSAFHRDDYGKRRYLPAESRQTELPFDVQDADLVLVDDILYTGRTVRAALNELFDYGRPNRVELAVLIDRGGRELPIEARYCGAAHPLGPEASFEFSREADGRFALRLA
ncbi:MAG: bifunctional pyr operon transcriptional regulator/uracil phosphoribosyltransferase PyrR [Pseudomonadota bacterium]|nr:bifunctional pyr operon transcriptional regulator/uracil phosphoribosyltransferase PyrR [Pseudomonadota bacterium]